MAKMIKSKKIEFTIHTRSLAWANKVNDGVWEVLYQPTDCRTYMSDFWWHTIKNPAYPIGVNILKDVKPDEDHTSIFFSSIQDEVLKRYSSIDECRRDLGLNYTLTLEEMVENVKKNLPILHNAEKQAGLEKLTEIEVCDDPSGLKGIVFVGDAVWHSNLWKQTLYTYYLKRLTYSKFKVGINSEEYSEYYGHLEYFGDKLLSKVKTEFTEIVETESFRWIHEYSGFVSICSKVNEKMYNLLLGGK